MCLCFVSHTPGCEGQFQNGHKLRDHFRSHTQEKLIACPTCGGLFSNRTKFYDHIKRQTPVEGWSSYFL